MREIQVTDPRGIIENGLPTHLMKLFSKHSRASGKPHPAREVSAVNRLLNILDLIRKVNKIPPREDVKLPVPRPELFMVKYLNGTCEYLVTSLSNS